ncbi:hypothetical protein T492DRAFT_1147835 [Pavlovales sp. CCMP2436]|nr:hypothetical protein T492DRAFT_1147835 [Pavlovales sp. CCMP2436]
MFRSTALHCPLPTVCYLHLSHPCAGTPRCCSARSSGCYAALARPRRTVLREGEDDGEADSDDEPTADAFAQSERLWVSRVHALNLLRHLFADRVFVIEMAPHLGAGFELALSALESSKWDVRNSGNQLVATLLSRAVRTRRNREDSSIANGVSARELFARAPALHGRLLGELRENTRVVLAAAAARRGGANADGEGAAAKAGEAVANPSLFACLLLLSKLTPPPLHELVEADTVSYELLEADSGNGHR